MDPEAITAWVLDQDVLLKACSDPDECRLQLQYSISAPCYRRSNILDNIYPTAKRRRVPLAKVKPNSGCKMPDSGESDLRQSPRRKESHKDQIYKLRHGRVECFRSSSLYSRRQCPSPLSFAQATGSLPPRAYENEAPAPAAALGPQAPSRILMTFLNSKSP
ncbi:hypothetical protein VTG60DRAFT_6628 [Thermothelomyces hinnuleus]